MEKLAEDIALLRGKGAIAPRFVGLTNPYGESTNWTYLDNNWVWTQQSGSILKSTYTYNALGQPTDLANTKKDLPNTLLSD